MQFKQILLRLGRWLWPDHALLDETQRQHRLRELIGVLYGAPLAAAGVVWLLRATDLATLGANWPILLLMLALAGTLNWLDFFWVVERRTGGYDRWSAPLGGLVTLSAALLFGPSAIWIGIILALLSAVRTWRAQPLATHRWAAIRTLVLNLAGFSLGALSGLSLYQSQGGTFPLPGLTWPTTGLAACAVLTLFAIDWLCWSGYLVLARWTRADRSGALELGLFATFELVAYVPELFGILAAAVYVQVGLAGYLFLVGGALLVSRLAERLSRAAERSGQRSRELAQLEQLGRSLLQAPPDATTLAELLARAVPPMFRAVSVEIRLLSGQTLIHTPATTPAAAPALWSWLRDTGQPYAGSIGARKPWDGRASTTALAAAPILSTETAEQIGGIYVRFAGIENDPAATLPAVQSLAAQIAAALYRAEEYTRTLAAQSMRQELRVAAEIQSSFLPETLPNIRGWQLAASLRPARETSGDFYDVLELPGGCIGLLIADVTDKGTGAALFMALSRTLIRTFAFEHPGQPALALQAANQRILADSRSSMFVTAFYGVLDPATGALVYCNAGHNPPFHLSEQGEPQPLRNTGIPLGITDEADWREASATLLPSDLLLLYTDGVTEAHNTRQELFENEGLLRAAQSSTERTAAGVHAAVLAAVEGFAGDAPQFDDLTVMVVMRAGSSAP